MTKSIHTKVEFNVTMNVEHPMYVSLDTVRLIAQSALRAALDEVNSSDNGFYQHSLADREDIVIDLENVRFA